MKAEEVIFELNSLCEEYRRSSNDFSKQVSLFGRKARLSNAILENESNQKAFLRWAKSVSRRRRTKNENYQALLDGFQRLEERIRNRQIPSLF
ncbi:MAG TPA: hypothetical protein PKA63_05180 [Oligoflexia bacterium]|nr:hypothetical protein [Oligoflexia bacterium]HMP48040.1 hypothetical protein [Oligoflexia bacterium]